MFRQYDKISTAGWRNDDEHRSQVLMFSKLVKKLQYMIANSSTVFGVIAQEVREGRPQ